MENLNESVMEQFIFTGKPHVTAKEVTINSGISRLIPEMQIDDYIFDGCGYSMNGLSGTNYLTIHITPEK
ncbi:AMP deaminase, partial [Tyrophagus putrescentiae]